MFAPALPDTANMDEGEVAMQLQVEQFRRVAARNELAELGVTNVAPGDIESWLSYSPAQKRRASWAWLVYSASYS